MTPKEQIEILEKEIYVPNFNLYLKERNSYPLKAEIPNILQINISKKCNLSCTHCHVEASPNRTEMMSQETLKHCLEVAKHESIDTIDITGGAPELNLYLKWFLNQAALLDKRLILRTNLIILKDPNYYSFIDIYSNNKVEIITSLPHTNPTISNKQRGDNFFQNCIEIIKILNKKGYGQENSSLLLHLVHNPAGAFLPGSQSALEKEYKHKLIQEYGIRFNTLFCLNNIPIGRYLDYLVKTENLQEYMCNLVKAFNINAVGCVMCKNTISVAWNGTLYDCDFNQILELPISIEGKKVRINNFSINDIKNRTIITANHCFGCVAGAGSSCQGATIDE